jgi:hypothetical protein
LENPDAFTASAISARDEIGRAVADKIRAMKSAKDLTKVVEEVLPQIEEFLETPEDKRLRRLRSGVITAAIGLGAALAFTVLGMITRGSTPDDDYLVLLFMAGLGLTTFLIGLGIIFNGWRLTIPQKRTIEQSSEPFAQTATKSLAKPAPEAAAQERMFASFVTEHTTRQLPDDQSRASEAKLE